MKRTSKIKLTLNKESIRKLSRQLEPSELDVVVGGRGTTSDSRAECPIYSDKITCTCYG